jgi:YQGE family putative transporter
MSTISIFIPIYLLEMGYQLNEVCYYLIFWVLCLILTTFAALKLAGRYGVKHIITLSVPLTIAFFVCLYFIEDLIAQIGGIPTIALLAVVKSLAAAFYFMGFHLDFARFSEKEKGAAQLGAINATSTIITILGPLLGALIITASGYQSLFIFVMIVLLFSIIPMFFSEEFHERFDFRITELAKTVGKHNSWPFFAEGVRFMAAAYFWPILFFFTIKALSSIGLVYSISKFLVAALTFYIGGRLSDLNKKKILRLGGYIHSLTLMVRTVLKTVFAIAVVQGFGGISYALINLPFQSIFYRNSKKIGIAYMTYFRELYMNIGRLCSILVLLFLLMFIEQNHALISAIIIGALAVFIMMNIEDE